MFLTDKGDSVSIVYRRREGRSFDLNLSLIIQLEAQIWNRMSRDSINVDAFQLRYRTLQ